MTASGLVGVLLEAAQGIIGGDWQRTIRVNPFPFRTITIVKEIMVNEDGDDDENNSNDDGEHKFLSNRKTMKRTLPGFELVLQIVTETEKI